MADEEESGGFIVGSGGGRGRGRGGGVPVLPAGIWSALNSSEGAPGLQSEDPSFGDDAMPMGFGRGRGSAAGRGAGRGSDAGRGRGFVRDAKGTDWDCPSCGNVNWHWRSTCNKCNGAKPAHILTAEEVRDGVGGGFNERQDRVSTTSVEVAEDGFDDFGRRKKKAAADRSAKEAAALARLQQSYGFLLHQPAAAEADSDKLKPSSAASTAGGRKSSYGFSASAQFADAEDDGPKTIRPSFGSSNATANGGNGATSGSSNKPGQSSGKSQNDRDRDRDRDADREREKDRDRSNRDKDTSNTRDRDRERSRDRDRVRDRSRDRDRDRSRDRDRDRDRSGRESGRGGESARDSGRDDRYPAYRGDKDRDRERDNRDRDRYRDHR